MKHYYYKFFFFILFTISIISCKKDPFEKESGTFIDSRDNHKYKWVRIGNQIWMTQNLAYAPTVCAPIADCGIYVYDYLGSGAYSENLIVYGCLYNWETAQQVCPDGWHLPSDEEWMELENFLGLNQKELDKYDIRGEDENIGGKLKETGITHWNSPNTGATDEVGFGALAGGLFHERFLGSKDICSFWTSSKVPSEEMAIGRALYSNYKGIMRNKGSLNNTLSIRCIKDKI